MDRISGIASSALNSYGIRQAVTADNISKMNTTDSPVSVVRNSEEKTGGTSARIEKTNDRVELSREATNMLQNRAGFTANIKTLQTSDEMARTTLNIKA